MSDPVDLEQVIADSVNDSMSGVEDTSDISTDVETSSEPVEAPESAPEPEVGGEAEASLEVPSPATSEAPTTPPEPEDEFAKLAGMPKMGVGGRENRIPYSRVQQITKTAVNKLAETVLGRKLEKGEDAHKLVKGYMDTATERETKITEYETRLKTVDEFENIMETDPNRFLNMLSGLPTYKEFFDFVNSAIDARNSGVTQPQQTAAPEPPADPDADMPQPDELLPDGSSVYSLDGLKSLLKWQAGQTEARLNSTYEAKLKAIEDRYGPMANDWQEYQRKEAVRPMIRKQMEEAKTWAMWDESEEEVLQVLQKNPNISLEGAYREVVFPKLIADRNKVRQEVIQEVKKAPVASSMPSRAATKPVATSGGPRSLEDIIKESISTIK
jgi:hypothetical protein